METVKNLSQFYVYEMSRYCGFLKGWETPSNGLYESNDLSCYWKEPDRYPYLIKVDNELAGFALVNKIGSTPEVDWNMGEFFIVSKYQKKGVGRHVAEEIFKKFPGIWEVMQIPENKGAIAFWEKVIDQYSKGHFQKDEKIISEPKPHPMLVLKFNSKIALESNSCCKILSQELLSMEEALQKTHMSPVNKVSTRSLVQYSGIEAFDLKVYDGSLMVSQLPAFGDFGLGCFNTLDGELIYFDQKSYQATSDGTLKYASPHSAISCGYFSTFSPLFNKKLMHAEKLPSLLSHIKSFFTHAGQPFCAIRLKGHFETISLRSVPPQKKPYLPLDEVVKMQSLYTYVNVAATIIGYYFPTYFNGLTYPGFHLHFVTDDLKHGGHVLDFEVENAVLSISPLEAYTYLLPDYACQSGGFRLPS